MMEVDNSSVDIRKFFQDKFQIENPEALKWAEGLVSFRTVHRGEKLLEAGEVPVHLSILWSGICRGFLVDENGHDTTDCFSVERGDVLWGCGPLDEPSIIGMEALTECELIQIPMESLLKRMGNCNVMRIINRCLSEALERHWNIRFILCQGDAMKRYLWFLKTYPGLVDQVNKRHIASFLGMTAVSLSRLRKRLREDSDQE